MPPRHGEGGEEDEELSFEGAQGLLDEDEDDGGGGPAAGEGGEHGSGELRGPKLIATLIKSFIGSGVLFLPKAFENGGWLFSVLSMLFMALVSGLCIIRLIRCREVVKGTYGQVGRAAVGPWGQVAVDTSLVLSQAGFCCVYVVFIARNVLQLLNSSSCWIDGSWLWLLILLEWPLFTPLTWVRKLARFGPTNLLADGIIAGGLMGILAYAGHGMASLPAGTPVTVPAFNSGSFSLMLGTAVYAFEGIGMVLPIYDALAPAQQKAFPVTMSLTLAGVALVYITVGLVPYIYLAGMAGVPMEDAVTLNLPRVWWSYLITGGYCVALLFSYPLMLFPAVRILERAAAPYLFVVSGKEAGASLLMNGGGGGGEEEEAASSPPSKQSPAATSMSGRPLPKGHFKWRRNAYRAGIVFVTLLVAYVGSEQLDNFVSLIGCFCCTPLAFIYPSLFHLRIVKGASLFSKAVDVAVLLFGVGILVFSTYEAIAGWSVVAINPCLSSVPG
jgi:solute carrier family 36 (proton-coupled amino acid transporter)